MKKFLTVALALAPTVFFAQITPPKPATEVVKVVEEAVALTTIELDKTTHDFGVIDEGDIVKTTFVVTNTGNEPLMLNKPKVSCGCTTPAYPKVAIQPGESGEIEVQFNSKNKPNKQVKSVTLTGNFEESPKKLTFTALVTPSVASEKIIAEKEKAIQEAEKAKEAKKEAEELEKEQEKLEKEAEKLEKEVEKARNKTEKELKKEEKARKKLNKQQGKVNSLEEKIHDAEQKLAKDKLKFDEKNNAGKLAPVDISKWEKKYRGKELAIEKLKAKLKNETAKLARLQ